MSGMPITAPGDLSTIAPELILAGAGVLVLLLDAFLPGLKRLSTPLTALGLILAGIVTAFAAPGKSFHGLLEVTPITTGVTIVVLVAALLATLASHGFLIRESIYGGEYFALLLWAATGMVLMARATELLTVFVALELFSICLYSLVGYHRRIAISTEGAIKYFLMGAFVSGFLLYGVALLFGETGTTRFSEIGDAIASGVNSPTMAALGLLLLICGFAFKMSLVPFHAWSPDAYQGAPSPFASFLSVAPKAASALILIRVLEVAGPRGLDARWPELIATLAVLSMLVGNLLALAQRDIKRMLAYSGIAHMGYLLVPLCSLDASSMKPVVVYLLAYAFMNAGAFLIVGILYAKPGEQHLIDDLGGWGYRYPFLAACLGICMLSLAGMPPMFGFIGKYLVFMHAVQHAQVWLAIAIVLTSLIGVYYYLRVIYVLYMKAEVKAPEGIAPDAWGRLAAFLAALATVAFGIWPSRIIEWLTEATRAAL